MSSRPVRPTTATLTLGPHSLEFTWCIICHAIIRVQLIGAPGISDFADALNLIEDKHYKWHDRTGA